MVHLLSHDMSLEMARVEDEKTTFQNERFGSKMSDGPSGGRGSGI